MTDEPHGELQRTLAAIARLERGGCAACAHHAKTRSRRAAAWGIALGLVVATIACGVLAELLSLALSGFPPVGQG